MQLLDALLECLLLLVGQRLQGVVGGAAEFRIQVAEPSDGSGTRV